MTEELEQLLKNLKLRRMLNVYDEQLGAAEKADVSYSEFVAGLLRAQWHDRQESADQGRRTTPTLSGDKLSSPASLVVSGASAERICRNAGRWKRSPTPGSPASTANRSAPSPSSTSSPSTRIRCWPGRRASGKRDWLAGSC
jgi:hypothetical protein